jgi:hypothetical protein
VALHINCPIADSPDLVLSSNASLKTGAVFGTEVWDTPEIMYKIQALWQQDMLPSLELLFVVFIRGASKTMERFTKEYAMLQSRALANTNHLAMKPRRRLKVAHIC